MRKGIIIVALLMVAATLAFGTETTKITAQADTFTGVPTEVEKQQDEAYQLYKQLLESLPMASGATEEYPEYYSGAYIDANNHLVVLIKEGEETDIQNIAPLSSSNSYTVETRKYSLNELNLANQRILEFVCNYENSSQEQKALIEKTKGVSISQKDNKVYINVDGSISDDEKAILLNLVTDSNIIEFVNEAGMVAAATLQPGAYLSTPRKAGLSAGFRCQRSGRNGFVTASHGNIKDGDFIYDSSNHYNAVGKVYGTTLFGWYGDAAFVEFDQYNDMSNTVYDTPISLVGSHYPVVFPEGYTIHFRGATSGYKTGDITKSSESYLPSPGVAITDLVKVNVVAKSGDSGGITFMYINGDYIPAGCVSAATEDGSAGMLFTKITNIVDKLNVIPY